MANLLQKLDNYKEKWHILSELELFKILNSSSSGLSSKEAALRLDFYGKNKLPHGKKNTLIKIIFRQILNPLILILILAAIASLVIGEVKDAVFIFLIIFTDGCLGVYQEYNAEKNAESLQKLIKIKSLIKRDKKEVFLDSENIVPGDIIIIKPGLKIPADIRLIQSNNISVDESFLTGESEPVQKKIDIIQAETIINERYNMIFAGSTIISGFGLGIVVATSTNTQVGQITTSLNNTISAKSPLTLRMEKFVKQIAFIVIILSLLITVILKINNYETTTIFFLVVALAVAAIPEGLPIAFTMSLSIATKKMLKKNVIIRHLAAVESLGSCTVIASDKTGTLTVNKQTARCIILPDGKKFLISGEGYNDQGKIFLENELSKNINPNLYKEINEINKISVLANEAELKKENENWDYHGDPIDIALLALSYKLNKQPKKIKSKYKVIDKIPYESEKSFSGAFFTENNTTNIAVKGAVETILNFCHKTKNGEKLNKESILKQAETLSKKGYRVLAFAQGEYKSFIKKDNYPTNDISKLEFIGLVCFMDPLRAEAKKSITKCKQAGIKVIMITGDHPTTAKTIAQEVGIIDKEDQVVTGQMLSELNNHNSVKYKNLIKSTLVFARITPIQKLEIIDILIKSGEFVAVTGDGVNDAPALKKANLSIAMGSGTDVAKEVSSMIITDDNFSSIVSGIEEGRIAYDNIRKIIYLLISIGASVVILFIISLIFKLPIPLIAVQLLWLNLITNGIQDVAMAFEGGEDKTMKKPPRDPNEKIFNQQMIQQTLISGLTIGGIAFLFWYFVNKYTSMDEFTARNSLLLLLVLMQNFHAFNCRSEFASIFKISLKKNWILILGIIISQAIHIISMYTPLIQEVLQIKPVSFKHWIYTMTLASIILIVMEFYKKIINKKIINNN